MPMGRPRVPSAQSCNPSGAVVGCTGSFLGALSDAPWGSRRRWLGHLEGSDAHRLGADETIVDCPRQWSFSLMSPEKDEDAEHLLGMWDSHRQNRSQLCPLSGEPVHGRRAKPWGLIPSLQRPCTVRVCAGGGGVTREFQATVTLSPWWSGAPRFSSHLV